MREIQWSPAALQPRSFQLSESEHPSKKAVTSASERSLQSPHNTLNPGGLLPERLIAFAVVATDPDRLLQRNQNKEYLCIKMENL